MHVEIFWEVESRLYPDDLISLSKILEKIAAAPDKFSFFILENYPGSLHLNIIIVDDTQITKVNKEYRHKNKATDVLTFEFDTDPLADDAENYGEIYISQDTAIAQSSEHKLSLCDEFTILIVHGLLHAFGYDHETSPEDAVEMKGYEKQVLDFLGIHDASPLTN